MLTIINSDVAHLLCNDNRRYVNRKGVALPTSSEETKRAKRENLEQKQILVPELCTLHPFPASLWRKAVCLPCILYRINALLLADQIRREVAISIALGHEDLCPSENLAASVCLMAWCTKCLLTFVCPYGHCKRHAMQPVLVIVLLQFKCKCEVDTSPCRLLQVTAVATLHVPWHMSLNKMHLLVTENPQKFTRCGKGTWRSLKCIMLATPKDELAGTMSFASVTDAITVTMESSGARDIMHLLLKLF